MVLSMERWAGKVAIVTGASSGIGAATVEALVKEGLQVVGLARRRERVEALANKLAGANGKLYAIKADMSKEEDILNAFKWVKDNLGPIHVLVNNAGTVTMTSLGNGDTNIWRNIFEVNVIGLSIATREAINDMQANKVNGHIIHINSGAGHRVPNIPNLNVYPASKHAVTALAETLRLELMRSKSKIKITNLSPGVVDTELVPDFLRAAIEKSRGNCLEAADIADGVVYMLSTPPHVQIQELTIKPVNESFLSK